MGRSACTSSSSRAVADGGWPQPSKNSDATDTTPRARTQRLDGCVNVIERKFATIVLLLHRSDTCASLIHFPHFLSSDLSPGLDSTETTSSNNLVLTLLLHFVKVAGHLWMTAFFSSSVPSSTHTHAPLLLTLIPLYVTSYRWVQLYFPYFRFNHQYFCNNTTGSVPVHEKLSFLSV